jgi:hypothetical protein
MSTDAVRGGWAVGVVVAAAAGVTAFGWGVAAVVGVVAGAVPFEGADEGCGGGGCGAECWGLVALDSTSWMFGGKMGSSGCRIVAWRRRDTRRGCGRLEKYARFYEGQRGHT